MKFSMLPGHLTARAFLPLHLVTAGLTSGICHLSGKNKPRMTKRMGHQNCYSFMEVYNSLLEKVNALLKLFLGHTARPTDFSWAPGKDENWTVASASEDNVVMVWQPTMRVWAGDAVKIDEEELEADGMEGVESAPLASGSGKGKSSANASQRSQSMDVSTPGDD